MIGTRRRRGTTLSRPQNTFKTYQMADLSAKAIAGSQKCRGAPDRVRVTYSLNRMVNRPPIVGLCSFNTGHAGDRLRHGSSVPILLQKVALTTDRWVD